MENTTENGTAIMGGSVTPTGTVPVVPAKKNETMTLRGYPLAGPICDLPYDQPFSDVKTSGKHYGMPVTIAFHIEMIDRFRKVKNQENQRNIDTTLCVDFSKASIMRILAQEECEYIRFYYALPDVGSNNSSLTLQGINTDKDPLKLNVILEVADKMQKQRMKTNQGPIDEQVIYNSLTSLPPLTEEKGNTAHGMTDIGNIISSADFIASLGPKMTDLSLADFVKAYYKFVKSDS